MDRREALALTTSFLGATLVGSQVFLGACSAPQKGAPMLADTDIPLLNALSDGILPDSESSPGAGKAGVGQFIKSIVSDCYSREEEALFIEGLRGLESGVLARDTYDRILRGECDISTWNRASVLDQPHRDFANNLKSLIPLFSRLPRFMLPLFKWLCGFRLSIFQKLFFFAGYPFFDTVEFRTKLADYISLYLFYRRKNGYGTHPVVKSKVHAGGNLET